MISLIQLMIGFALAETLAPKTPVKIITLNQTEANGFRACGLDCEYGQANALHSQKVVYIHQKNSTIKAVFEALRKLEAISEEDRNEEERTQIRIAHQKLNEALVGTCINDEGSSTAGLKKCFERYKEISFAELNGLRNTMIRNSDTIRSLQDTSTEAFEIGLVKPENVPNPKVQAPEVRTIEKIQKDYQDESKALNEIVSEEYRKSMESIPFKPNVNDYVLWKKDPNQKAEDVEYRLEVARDCVKVELPKNGRCACEPATESGPGICYDENAYKKHLAHYESKKNELESDRKTLIGQNSQLILPESLNKEKTGSISWNAFNSSQKSLIEATNRAILGPASSPPKKDDKSAKTKPNLEKTASVNEVPDSRGPSADLKVRLDQLPLAWTPSGGQNGDVHVRYSQKELDALVQEESPVGQADF